MKILHTADWHLGKKLEGFSRLEEQRTVLAEICEIAEREDVDAVCIAGDLFDTPNPSIEALELFYQTLKKLTNQGNRPVIGIGGNHDSPDRIEAPDPLARASGIILVGYPQSEVKPFELKTGLRVLRSAPGFLELKLPGYSYPLRLLLTPYANELRLRTYLGEGKKEHALRELLQANWEKLAHTYCDAGGVNILMAHLFVSVRGEETQVAEDEEEKSLIQVGGAQEIFSENFPKGLHYAALGHLHSPWTLREQPFPIAYSSSPLYYSFGDRSEYKAVNIVEAEPGKAAQVRQIPLTRVLPLVQETFPSLAHARDWLETHQNLWVELSLETETYLKAKERKLLLDLHPRIVRIIPKFTRPELLRFTSGKEVNLNQDIESLFNDFFQFKKGGPPNDTLQSLFKEILQEEVEE